MDTQPPNDFNWVEARANCNLVALFECLLQRVQHDVCQANKHDLANADNEFSFEPKMDDICGVPCFGVIRKSKSTDARYQAITFQRYETEIVVEKEPGNSPDSVIVPEWNGKELCCEYLFEGEPRKVWEISKIVLEPLFFRNR